ncbi:MAG: hypothetical protein KUG75_01885, partial [Pseudomonadales bacterium]|nr:hypothetical protein [Pseudomonadales bacterium]
MSDFYFKRSYSPSYLHQIGSQSNKIYPLGLNYEVYPDFWDHLGFERTKISNNITKRLVYISKAFSRIDQVAFTPRVSRMEALPDFTQQPQILFIAKAYDPHDDPKRKLEKIQEREHNNNTRANCIRLLRKEFGNSFFGGMIRSQYSETYYKDVLLP